MASTDEKLVERFAADGLLRQERFGFRTTRRWQGALSRAAARLLAAGCDGGDLRMPVACALFELYGDIEDEEFARMIAVMTPIEARELDPRPHLARRTVTL